MLSHTEVFVQFDGSLYIPSEILQSSGIKPGSKLYCITHSGQLTLISDVESPPSENAFDPTLDFDDFIGTAAKFFDCAQADEGTQTLSLPTETEYNNDLHLQTFDTTFPSEPLEAQERRGDKRTKKRRKDPSAPKRNLNAYSFFTKHITPIISHEYPDLDFKERALMTSRKWKELSTEMKKPFFEIAAIDKQRYEDELAEIRKESSPTSPDTATLPPPDIPLQTPTTQELFEDYTEMLEEQLKSKEKPKKDKFAPKRNVSSFSIFTKIITPQIIEKYPEMGFQERAKLVSQKWNSLDETQKKPFLEQALLDRARYAQEYIEYIKRLQKQGKKIDRRHIRKFRERGGILVDYNDAFQALQNSQ